MMYVRIDENKYYQAGSVSFIRKDLSFVVINNTFGENSDDTLENGGCNYDVESSKRLSRD